MKCNWEHGKLGINVTWIKRNKETKKKWYGKGTITNIYTVTYLFIGNFFILWKINIISKLARFWNLIRRGCGETNLKLIKTCGEEGSWKNIFKHMLMLHL